MKKFHLILFLSILTFLLFSCKEGVIHTDTNSDPIVNIWVYKNYHADNNSYEYKALTSLSDNLPGFIFMDDGSAIVRENAGWCGTPPLTYKNFKGSWYFESDSVLHLTTEYWASQEDGHLLEYRFKIEELDDTKLIISYL